MFLTKLKNGYYYIYFIDVNGKRNKISARTKIKSEARDFLISFQSNFAARKKEKTEPLTLKQFRWKFLTHSESYHSWKTTLDYKSTFNEMDEFFGNMLLTEFTQRNIEEFIQYKIRKKSLHTGRRHLINIKAMLNKAVSYGYLEKSPASAIKRIKPPERLPLFFSKEEFNKLLEVIDNQDWKDLVSFAVNTGLRQMEILNLHKRQFNMQDRIVILDNHYHTTKSRKIRNMPMNNKAFDIVSRRVDNAKGELIFTLNGERILQDNLQDKFREFVEAAELNTKLTFHSLRHTFTSWLVQKGVSIYEVSKLLGHADIKTTQIYAHLRADDLRNAVLSLDGNI
jgi:integrase